MVDVILVRHGHHDELGRVLSGRSDIPLNQEGRAAAAVLAGALAGQAIGSLHTSPRNRTRETAAVIGERLGLGLQITSALDEVDFGCFAGRRFDALAEEPGWQQWNEQRDTVRCPGGETMMEAVMRAAAYLRALPRGAGPAVCVTHCDIIRGLVTMARGQRFADMFAMSCDPASRTMLTIGADGAISVNEINRLPG